MKVVQINSTCGIGSTGKICEGISRCLTENQIENYILFSSIGNDYSCGIRYSNLFYIKTQALQSRILGNYGYNSKHATKKLIAELGRIQPDIVHLHNIHSHDFDIEGLFTYFREKRTKLVWTFHDCWAFTGYCTYFSMIDCNKWKDECKECRQYKTYSIFFDKSNRLFAKKKELFSNLNLSIVTPSKWLEKLIKKSFLNDYPVTVINNGINLSIFKHRESRFREKYQIPKNKVLLLGVASFWEKRKGLDVFIELASILEKKKYQIVLVGTNEETNKNLPQEIITIHRTDNQVQLVEIYSAADIFINPTREDNFPTVNIEALACGTPVITFNTGGSPEIIDETCGSVVEVDDIDDLVNKIDYWGKKSSGVIESCINGAKQFEQEKINMKYIELYRRIISDRFTKK